MLGYLFNSRVGAVLHNIFHHYATGIAVSLVGLIIEHLGLILGGLVLIGHAALDRVFGYGLKYNKGFRYTLGED